MSEINLLDLVLSDIIYEIQQFLRIEDYFSLRCASRVFKNYIDNELIHLSSLELSSADQRFKKSFKILCEKCCRLKIIDLSENDWLTDKLTLQLLSQNANTITTLNLSNCTKLTADVLRSLAACKNLRKLRLQNCNWMTDGCLEAISTNHPDLEEIDLRKCKKTSERGLHILTTNCQKLKILGLASVAFVTDNVLFNISKYQTEIVHLNIFNCPLITNRGVGALSLNCEKLEKLTIRGCDNITEESLKLLRNRNVQIDMTKDIAQSSILRLFDRINITYLQI